jgi:hypothetical protein
MEAFTGFAQQGNVPVVTSGLSSTTVVEGSYPLCTVTVYLHGTLTLATIYSDNGITSLANPFTANSNGQFTFYAANNRYDVILSNNAGSGPASPLTLSDILLNDPAGGSGVVNSVFGRTGTVIAQTGDYLVGQVSGAAPLASPPLTGTPTAPTPPLNDNTTRIATTAFVTSAFVSPPVTSVFGRTGAVVAMNNDYSVTQVNGAAPLASPPLTGTPTAPTAAPGTSTTQLATTAFVQAALPAAGVTSFNSRTGAVAPASGDYTVGQVTGAAPLASPALTGVPTAPTPTIGDSSTKLATTQFVQQAGITPIIFAAVSLSSINLLALHVTPINLIPAPGAGLALYPLFVSLEYKFATTPYTLHGDSLKIDYGSTPTAFIQTFAEAGFFDQGSSQLKFFNAVTTNGSLSAVTNQPFTIYGAGGTDMTAGDGTAVVYIYYALVTLL